GRGHGLRARPGEAGVHRDGGVVDARKVADRKQPVRDDPEQKNARHEKGRGDGTPDEDLGEVHALPPPGRRICTFAPGERRIWPSVTTVSPGRSPRVTTVISSTVRSTSMTRVVTVESGFTTYTYAPCCPVETAYDGTTVAWGVT